ncbi:MAG TPA: ABC transporter substrate-binding protein [Acidimicrobiales bacterium]|nr:ABC transporter substrate-binding protein [Acidimicrobiales bacterium]
MTDLRARRYDRRTFLATGAGAAAALAMAKVGSPPFLDARHTPGIGTGKPRRGGTITIGTTSEIDGFLPSQSHFDATGYVYANTVYDTLTRVAANGTARPYLAQSVTPNSDLTSWTITLRPGISFHDGSPLNAEVVVANLQAIRQSALSGQAVRPWSSVQAAGDLQLVIDCDRPLVSLPVALATQIGYIVSMAQLDSNDTQHPVGTGPFKYVSWTPNDQFVVERNPAYWRSGLPYLDGITFKPIIIDTSREASLRSGTIDLMVTFDPYTFTDLRNNPNFQVVSDLGQKTGQPTMGFVCLNTTAAPLSDLTVRQALAHATNSKELVKLFGAGVTPVSSSLFPVGSPYRPAHNGYPAYDLRKAKQLVARAAPRHGGSVNVALGTVPDPRQIEIFQAIQNMWTQAGVNVTLSEVQQVTYIDNLVTGSFQAYADQQFTANDPDINYVWLSDTTASGPIALNFARNSDPQIEAALQLGRTHADPATRIEAYQTVDKLLARDIPYIWISRTVSMMGASNKVQNFANPTLPDGTKAEGFRGGAFNTSQIWLGA